MYLCTPYLSTNEAAKLGGKKKKSGRNTEKYCDYELQSKEDSCLMN